jgi:hypothetical protein
MRHAQVDDFRRAAYRLHRYQDRGENIIFRSCWLRLMAAAEVYGSFESVAGLVRVRSASRRDGCFSNRCSITRR